MLDSTELELSLLFIVKVYGNDQINSISLISIGYPMLLSSHTTSNHRFARQIPLRLILILPFVLQIFIAVGLTGFLSLKNGEKAVNDLASKLRQEVNERIDLHLDGYMEAPKQLTRLNTEALDMGLIDISNRDQLTQFFGKQIKAFNIGFVLYGFPNGDFVSAGYLFDEDVRNKRITFGDINQAKYGNPNFLVWEADQAGKKTDKLVQNFGAYPFQSEAWYAEGVQKQHLTWTKVYNWEAAPFTLAIASSHPVYSQNHQLLYQIKQWLPQTCIIILYRGKV